MSTVGVAVIGAGWWACEAHLPALQKHPDARIVAVQTQDLAKARKIAVDFGAENGFAETEPILADDRVDAVIIASTPNAHFAQARAALSAGKHVLIEKPMTLSVAEAQQLVDLAAERGLHFLISCPWHYTSHSLEAQRLIREGALGDIKMVSVLMTNFTVGLYRGLPWNQALGIRDDQVDVSAAPDQTPGSNSYSDAKIAGGGHIYCQVSHVAAYLSYLTGQEPTEVFARFDNADTNVDVYDAINMRMSGGTMVSLGSNGAPIFTDRQYELRVYGTEGMILMELWKGKLSYHSADQKVHDYDDLPADRVYPAQLPATNLVDVVLGRAENHSPATLGLSAMRVIEGACQSAKSGQNIVLEEKGAAQ